MTAEQWRRVRDVFEAALDAGRSDREWIEQHANDAVVADEVSSLLANHERAGLFLSQPALEHLADRPSDEAAVKPGTIVGGYEIVRYQHPGRFLVATEQGSSRTQSPQGQRNSGPDSSRPAGYHRNSAFEFPVHEPPPGQIAFPGTCRHPMVHGERDIRQEYRACHSIRMRTPLA